jgi:predicted DNA-binding transcriptional regulator AlpA
LPSEVDAITRTCHLMRVRMEKRGFFPQRVRVGARKTAYYRADIDAWIADPEGWRKAHAVDGGA